VVAGLVFLCQALSHLVKRNLIPETASIEDELGEANRELAACFAERHFSSIFTILERDWNVVRCGYHLDPLVLCLHLVTSLVYAFWFWIGGLDR